MKKLLAVVALAALLAGGWVLASPYWTLHQMRGAAIARDAAAISALVDFPSLREDLKTDFTAAMMAETAKDGADPMNALGMGLGMMVVGNMIDQFISPAGVEMLLAGERTEVFDPSDADDFEIVRDGFSRFRLRSASEPEKATLVFTRRGLGWVVTGVDLPREALAKTS